MKLSKIPDAAMMPSSTKPEFGTVAWVVFVLSRRGGSATFAEATSGIKEAEHDPARAMGAFQEALDAGLIVCHHVNKGKRGRPRYEFALQNEKGA